MDNHMYGKAIDNLRFRLFEIGFQLTEKQALFYVAKAWQLLQKISPQQYKKVSNVMHIQKNNQSSYAIQKETVLKLALSIAYNNLLPKLDNPHLTKLTPIQLEQMARPSAVQVLELEKNISFTIREYLQYCSHFNGRVSLMWYAVHIKQLSFLHEQYIPMLESYFPFEIMHWRSQLQSLGKYNLKEYSPLILHPWQYKHLINQQLKILTHEKLLLGPFNAQKMHACFDPSYLMADHQNACLYHTNLFKKQPIHEENINQLQHQLNKHHHLKNTFHCLFTQTALELNYNQVQLQSSFNDEIPKLTQDCDYVISVNGLININSVYSKPLLIELFGSKKDNFMCFFQSLLNKYLEIQQVLSEKFSLICPNEHILIGFRDKVVSKLLYRNPSVFSIKKNNKPTLDMRALKQILDCYFTHTGHIETFNTAMKLIEESSIKIQSLGAH